MGILDFFSDGSYRNEAPPANVYGDSWLARNKDRTPASVEAMQDYGEFLPFYGDLYAAGEAAEAWNNNQKIMAGLLGAGAIVGGVPVVGDYAAAGIKRLAPYAGDALGYLDNFLRFDEAGSVPISSMPKARNQAEEMAAKILDMRAAGREGEVTDSMMALADDQFMYHNTPLPMDVASRMTRADEMGADMLQDFYHGTAKGGLVDTTDIHAFDPARVGDRWNADRKGFSITSSPRDANFYAKPMDAGYGIEGLKNDNLRNGAIYPLNDLSQKPYELRPMDQYEGTIGAWDNRPDNTYDLIEAAGADHARIYADDVEMRVILDPSNLRSRFARYDPKFRHLANLSAGVGGLGLLTQYDEEGPR